MYCWDVLDTQQIIEDLIRLRKTRKLSQRSLAKILEETIGLSREIVRKIESREHALQVNELFAWLHACGASPALWMVQYLSVDEYKVRDNDRVLTRSFQQAIRNPARRKLIDELLKMWETDDKQPDRPPRSRAG